MPEHVPGPEGEATFTPSIDEAEARTRIQDQTPINDKPIRLTGDEYGEILGPDKTLAQQILASKEIPLDEVVTVDVDGEVFNIATDRNDIGTRIQYPKSDQTPDTPS